MQNRRHFIAVVVAAAAVFTVPAFALGSRLPYSEADSVTDQPDKVPQVATNAFRVFLGRAPVAGEEYELGKLFLPWTKTYFTINPMAGPWTRFFATSADNAWNPPSPPDIGVMIGGCPCTPAPRAWL